MNNTAKENKNFLNNIGEYAEPAINAYSTLNQLKNPKATGGKRLANIISTIMSFGANAATDAATKTE